MQNFLIESFTFIWAAFVGFLVVVCIIDVVVDRRRRPR